MTQIVSRILLLVVFLFLTSIPASAQDARVIQQFDDGTAALQDGRFRDALEAFNAAEASGWVSTELYYNTGLAYHRLDQLGQAIRYLERALSISPEDERIQHSLSIARSRQKDSFSVLPDPFWKSLHMFTATKVPAGTAFWLGIIAWFVFFGLLLANLLIALDGEWIKRIRSFTGIVGTVLLIHAIGTSAFSPFDVRAVVVEAEIALREQADPEAAEVVLVHEGLVVTREGAASGWVFIEIPNGTQGWIPESAIVGI